MSSEIIFAPMSDDWTEWNDVMVTWPHGHLEILTFVDARTPDTEWVVEHEIRISPMTTEAAQDWVRAHARRIGYFEAVLVNEDGVPLR